MTISNNETLKCYKLEIVNMIPLTGKYGVKEHCTKDGKLEVECFECLGLASCNIQNIHTAGYPLKGVLVYLYLNNKGEIIPESTCVDELETSDNDKKDAMDSLSNGIELVAPILETEKIKEQYLKIKEQQERDYVYFNA